MARGIFGELLDYVEGGEDGPVKYVCEQGACEECESHDGEIYDLEDAPELPIHPNCKCYYESNK